MITYYQLLGINPNATIEEIRSAYDEQYHDLSQRVMQHHDRSEKLKAEQKRIDLEKAFAILNDFEKRAEYDAKLETGGLIDPDPPQPGPIPLTPPPPSHPTQTTQKYVRVDAWVCPECEHPNAIGTRYCQKGGHMVGVDCPKCGKLVEAVATYCPNCQTELKPALEEERRKEKERQRQKQLQRLKDLQAQLGKLQDERDKLQRLKGRLIPPQWFWTDEYSTFQDKYNPGCGERMVISFFGLVGMLLFAYLSMSIIIQNPQLNQQSIGFEGCVVAPIVFVAWAFLFLEYPRQRLAKPKIDADIQKLDSRMVEVRKEMREIQTSSIR